MAMIAGTANATALINAVMAVYRDGQVQAGLSSSRTTVSPSSFSSTICVAAVADASAEISAAAWVTTTICVCVAAAIIRRARAGSRSGCRLVSGSLRIISAGGRGESRAAARRR